MVRSIGLNLKLAGHRRIRMAKVLACFYARRVKRGCELYHGLSSLALGKSREARQNTFDAGQLPRGRQSGSNRLGPD